MAVKPGKRLYVNADRSKIVDEDSPEAAFLLVGAAGELSDEDAARYGLTAKTEGKAPAKAKDAPPQTKAVAKAPANKGKE